MTERWKCADCGAVFDEPDERWWIEDHGEGMRERWTALVCPECGSEEVDEFVCETYETRKGCCSWR